MNIKNNSQSFQSNTSKAEDLGSVVRNESQRDLHFSVTNEVVVVEDRRERGKFLRSL